MTATAEQRVAYEQSRATSEDARRCLLAAFAYMGIPESMSDIGCGPGHLCELASDLGVEAHGYDITQAEVMTNQGIFHWIDLDRGFVRIPERPMVLCLEVAEHLRSDSDDGLIDTLVWATGVNGTLLFSAATPGQGGSGHLNEQPHDYWREKLESRGLTFDAEMTETLRRTWSEVAPTAWWYGQNVMTFRRPA